MNQCTKATRAAAQKHLENMASFIEEHGFHPDWQPHANSECGCFLHASEAQDPLTSDAVRLAERALIGVVGSGNFLEEYLVHSGWKPGCTQDAAAACRIAADLVAP